MAKITLSQAILILVWGVIISFVCNVGSDVFDHAPESECDYCSVANHTAKVRILDENERLLAFKNREPECTRHYIVIPKEHIKNIYSPEVTCELLKEMKDFCEHLLDEDGTRHERRILFNNPPFYSVTHLHLHCMACSPEDNSIFSSQYYINAFQSLAAPDITQICN